MGIYIRPDKYVQQTCSEERQHHLEHCVSTAPYRVFLGHQLIQAPVASDCRFQPRFLPYKDELIREGGPRYLSQPWTTSSRATAQQSIGACLAVSGNSFVQRHSEHQVFSAFSKQTGKCPAQSDCLRRETAKLRGPP